MLSECHVQIQSSATGDALNFFFLRKMASKHCVVRLGFCKVSQRLYKDIEIHDDVLNSSVMCSPSSSLSLVPTSSMTTS